MPIIGVIIAWLARIVGTSAVRFLAMKAFIWAVLITVLPTILNNFFVDIVQQLYNIYSSTLSGTGYQPLTVQLTGLTGYLATHLRIPEMLSILISAVTIRMTLNLIPFIGRM